MYYLVYLMTFYFNSSCNCEGLFEAISEVYFFMKRKRENIIDKSAQTNPITPDIAICFQNIVASFFEQI